VDFVDLDLIAECGRVDRERELFAEVMRLLNTATDPRELMGSVMVCLKRWTGFEAIGIRLQDDLDFPYIETSGFPERFVELENALCARDGDGAPLRDGGGDPVLECMCGHIIRGGFVSPAPYVTAQGSFWTNSTTDLLASTTAAERPERMRNRCHAAGYESVALVPLRADGVTFGLIQFNDRRRGRFTPERIALFERLADHLAIHLARRRAEERLRESLQQCLAAAILNAAVVRARADDPLLQTAAERVVENLEQAIAASQPPAIGPRPSRRSAAGKPAA
jgi:GAF domain-containing protein